MPPARKSTPQRKSTRQKSSTQRSRTAADRAQRARRDEATARSTGRDHRVYKRITVTATSPEGYSAAVRTGVAKARETMRGLSWWEVLDQRGRIDPESGEIEVYQVTLAIHFEVE